MKSLKNAECVIVQTNWMKQAIIKRTSIRSDKVRVVSVEMKAPSSRMPTRSSFDYFFYPAAAYGFKNHKIILDACKEIRNRGVQDIRVLFTLSGNENNLSKKIAAVIKEYSLPIEMIGQVDYEKMKNYYGHACVLFPSYLETVGLPLKEAKYYGCPIISADCEYAHEAVGDYKNINYFDYSNAKELALLMLQKNENRF